MPAIAFEGVTKVFGDRAAREGRPAAVRDVTLEVEQGELIVLLGPSGCGKTTMMRMVNRLIEPTSGSIYVDGQEIHQVPATQLRRHIGYVIQQVGLFPHMTVAANVATVPRLLGWDKKRIEARVDELLEMVALPPGDFRKRYPRQLSGGQQQRVGIARAMAADPAVLLMDEPFGAIDAITRRDLQNQLIAIQQRISKTIIFVTHDTEEALRLADRIAVMRDGQVLQYDRPFNILTDPANDFVAALLNTTDVLQILSLVRVDTLMQNHAPSDGLLTIDAGQNARTALSMLVANGADELAVTDHGKPVGVITLSAILHEAARRGVPTEAGA